MNSQSSEETPYYYVVIIYPDGCSTIYNNREKMTLDKATSVRDEILETRRDSIRDCRIWEILEFEQAVASEDAYEAIIGEYHENA